MSICEVLGPVNLSAGSQPAGFWVLSSPSSSPSSSSFVPIQFHFLLSPKSCLVFLLYLYSTSIPIRRFIHLVVKARRKGIETNRSHVVFGFHSQAFQRHVLAPTGASHALSVILTRDAPPSVISHLITARDSLVQIWEVVEMTRDGKTTAKLHHLLSRRLVGTVTSLSRVRTLASKLDGADRVLITFLDAKMSLMEWTPSAHDLLPVSLHTFEKLPQVVEGRRAKAATDPASRLSVLLLPTNTGGDGTLAILPFFQEELDLEGLGVDQEAWGTGGLASLPYAPSHLLPLSALTQSNATFAIAARSATLTNAPSVGGPPPVRNVIDMVFLPGFTEPTLAILYAPETTWTARLENVHSNCLVSLVTLASGAAKAGAHDASGTTTAVVIATSPALPYSSLAIHPCPPDLGGTLVVTANGILHLEQGGKLMGAPANGWFAKEYSGPVTQPRAGDVPLVEKLEGSRVVFVANRKAIVYCKTGSVLELTLTTSGRSISGIRLQKVASGVAASCVERIRGSAGQFGEEGYVFVGSEVGESSLVSWEVGAEQESWSRGAVSSYDDGMDLDDDDEDIYGDSGETKAATTSAPSGPKRSLTLRSCDLIESWGAIRSLAVGLVDDESPAELVACTGNGVTAGFTVFHRTISPRKRRKFDSEVVATRGIWSLSISSPSTPPTNILISSDAEMTQMSHQSTDSPTPDVVLEEPTIYAGAFVGAETFARVSEERIVLHGAGLAEAQALPLPSKAIRAMLVDSILLVAMEGNETAIFHLQDGVLVASELPSNYSKFDVMSDVDQFFASSVFPDRHNLIPVVRPAAATKLIAQQASAGEEEEDLYAAKPKRSLADASAAQAERIVQPDEGVWRWLTGVNAKGDLEILLLPSLEVVFSASLITLLPDVIEDGSVGGDSEGIDEDDLKVDRVGCFAVGQDRLRPHLIILMANGSLAIYEACPSVSSDHPSSQPRSLGVRFVKSVTRRLPIPRRARTGDQLPPPRREFVPFSNLQGYSGLLVTGEDPLWLIASDHGPVRIYDSSDKAIYGFSSISTPSAEATYVAVSKLGTFSATLTEGLCFDRELAYSRIPRDRRYSAVAFDIDSGMYAAGALFDTEFMNFDDEGQPIFVSDSPNLTKPTNYRSALELIIPGTWQAIDGYEFRANEFISTIKSVSLASRSTATGRKDFIAVGTTVFRAEDLAARGGVYLFEVIKINPDPRTPTHDHRLKLLAFEEAKSVVGNICDIDGYLVMSMGQKLYVRAFEQDEVMIAVGFLDVGVHVTSLQAMKNFLLIGDALQSVTLVAFQEDPYRLVLLGRDYRPGRTASANFLVNDGKVAFVVSDLDGIIRLLEYDPANIASHAGQRLMCRTEYRAGAEGGATLLYAKRAPTARTEELRQNGILYGGIDGSLYTLVPVSPDAVFKRLQLLQAQLTKHVQHFIGLNPRGHRIVKNDSVSRALTKGILDGEVLAAFDTLPLDRQQRLAEQIGSDPDTILLNLRNLASW